MNWDDKEQVAAWEEKERILAIERKQYLKEASKLANLYYAKYPDDWDVQIHEAALRWTSGPFRLYGHDRR